MLKRSLSYFWHHTSRMAHVAIVVGGLLTVLVGAAILGLRYWVLPNIMQYHDRIELAVGDAIGQKVQMGEIRADWNGYRPRLSVDEVRVLDNRGETGLVLKRVDGTLSWRSMLSAQLRLSRLELTDPQLVIRRDASGQLYVAGIPLASSSNDNTLANWLLRQRHVAVRRATVSWYDEKRGAEPLFLRDLELRIENRGSRHRFAVQGVPPRELATPLDLRGELTGKSFDRPEELKGEVFVQIDHTNVNAWRTWLDLPASLGHGRGGLRAWVAIDQGKLAGVTADLDLHDVVSKLGKDVPELNLHTLHGRLAWSDVDGEFVVSTKRLALRAQSGTVLPPTDFYLRLTDARGDRPASGQIRANQLHLPTLMTLAEFFPMEQSLRHGLQTYAPRGQLKGLDADWKGPAEALTDWHVRGHFDGLGLTRNGAIPGFAGLSGEVDGSRDSGNLSIAAHDLHVEAPEELREPLQFDRAAVQARWKHERAGWTFEVVSADLSNADVQGRVYGSYRTEEKGPGTLELSVKTTRARVASAARYIPLVALDRQTHDWLATALQGGQADRFRLYIKGNLDDFPFPDNRKGRFEIQAHAKDVTLAYAPEWPSIEHAEVDLNIQGGHLAVTSPEAETVGARLSKVEVSIADLLDPDLPLEIRGNADGETLHALDFIQQSPVRGYINGFTDDMKVAGSGHLDLYVKVPLASEKPVKVEGTYRFHDNAVEIAKGVPPLSDTNGELHFSESGMETRDLTARVLGGPARIQVRSDPDGSVHAKASGDAVLDALRGTEPYPVMRYLRGRAAWTADVSVIDKLVSVVVNSNLQGMASDLPVPFRKRAEESVALRFEQRAVQPGQDTLLVRYGDLLTARMQRTEAGDEMHVTKGDIHFGAAAKSAPEHEGLWVTGELPELCLQGWDGMSEGGKRAAGLPMDGVDLKVLKLTGWGLALPEVRLNGKRRDQTLLTQMSSPGANGQIEWSPQGTGKVMVRLKNLVMQGEEADSAGKMASGASRPLVSDPAPALDLQVDSLNYKGRQIGRLVMQGHPQGGDWRLERMQLVNPDATLSVDGLLRATGDKQQTTANVTLDVVNAGKILDRSGYPDSVQGGSGRLSGKFNWVGGMGNFSYAALNGDLQLEAGKGKFLKIDPGIGKLLGILSLQALPRRVKLDFNDVFSEGFQFERIAGNASIRHGVMHTDDFRLEGAAADVAMKGEVDLAHETQSLRITVIPSVGNSVSLVGALVLNPVVGIGTFVANKLLRNPLDKLVAFDYNVTGSWVDPKVEKGGRKVLVPLGGEQQPAAEPQAEKPKGPDSILNQIE